MLQEFYAVTLTSIYRVFQRDCEAVAVKIALKGESKIPVGDELTGPMVAVRTNLQFFIPEGGGVFSPIVSVERHIENVNTFYWLGRTSPIVALFLTEQEARDCFMNEELERCDRRWLESTKKVIAEIGEDNPVFTVCTYPPSSLIQE